MENLPKEIYEMISQIIEFIDKTDITNRKEQNKW